MTSSAPNLGDLSHLIFYVYRFIIYTSYMLFAVTKIYMLF